MKTLKTAFLLTALTLLLLFIGQALGGSNGMMIALVFAVLMNGGAYFFSDKIALRSSGAVPISRDEAPRLYAVMERLAAKANLPMPKLYLIPQAAPNAFATGRNPSHASVAVTQGLMEIMNDDELEGVIAHELSHVRNYDILTSSVAATQRLEVGRQPKRYEFPALRWGISMPDESLHQPQCRFPKRDKPDSRDVPS